MDTFSNLQLGTLTMGLLGGLALFLLGMERLTDALKAAAGSGLRRVLARLTTTRLRAALAGAGITALIQSSSVTTVLVVGFVSAGVMTLPQSIGVIMGANVGTTVTAQIIAFKVTQYALLMIALGFAATFLGRRERIQQYGGMLLGLGLVFFGMELMSDATRPLRNYQPFVDLLAQMANPLLGIAVAALFTALVQSSSATTGIVIVLAGQGFITLEAGIALIFGANVGTSVTAMLAAIGKPRPAVQAAVVHVLFNVAGVLLWIAFIGPLADVVRAISPSAPEDLVGGARLAVQTPRQIANAHTVFNVANTLLFIGLVGPMASLVRWLVPDRPPSGPAAVAPKYLDAMYLEAPGEALEQARLELLHLGEHVSAMLQRSLDALVRGDRRELRELATMDDAVDRLQGAVVTFLGELSREPLTREASARLHALLTIANHLENIGDTIETNLTEAGLQRAERELHVGLYTERRMRALHERVQWSLARVLEALATGDRRPADEVIAAKAEINALASAADAHLTRRLVARKADRLALFRIESDALEHFKRVYYFTKRIAKVLVEVAEEGDADPVAPVAAAD